MQNSLQYRSQKPSSLLADFVDSFWMLINTSDTAQEVVVLPDGRIDLFFSKTATTPYRSVLLGLDTYPKHAAIAPHSTAFAISFKLPAVEYILKQPVATLLNSGIPTTQTFIEINHQDLNDFDLFCSKTIPQLEIRIPPLLDVRKQKLFKQIYQTNGTLSINQLAAETGWSSRQIHRYFRQWFGIPPKSYCDILRFRAAFEPLKAGALYPEGNFNDQSHFIRHIKKFSGVVPKELNKNKNDRFIQLSTLSKP